MEIVKINSPSNSNSILDSHRRCLIDDFMTLDKGTEIIVLLPLAYVSRPPQKDHDIDELKVPNASFRSKQCASTKATTSYSPCSSRVPNSVTRGDLDFGFANRNC